MRALLLAGILTCSACATPAQEVAPAAAARPAAVIYLVSHGWHTGIVVRRADIPAGLWPEAADFPAAEYLEVGWGDRDFYQAPDPGVWLAARAALGSTASVLHVVGFRGPVADYFAASEVVELPVSADGRERLVRYVHDAHAREAERAAALGKGLYGDSRFYPAREQFHLFNTCNVWTSRALRAAGFEVTETITTDGVMSQARRLGRVVRPPPQQETER